MSLEVTNNLYHFGILGMKWGRRKGITPKAEADFRRRSKVIKKIKAQGKDAETDLGTVYVLRGEKAANRILDLMSKNPERSFRSASIQQQGETFAKNLLISAGAIAVGYGLSRI
jgi:hypothetical protein